MAIAFGERATSPEFGQDSATSRYWVMGETDEAVVLSTLAASLPTTLGGLTRTNIRIEPIKDGVWDAEVTYSLVSNTPTAQQGQPTFSFDTGGGTQHITQSLLTVSSTPAPGLTAPDFKGAIGVTKDSIEGVDIVVPVYQFTETHVLKPELVDDTYKRLLMTTTGRFNTDNFAGFLAGEVLFLGASGTQRGNGDWEITFRFAASENADNLQVGDITVASKFGWDYLWTRYEETVDAASNTIVKRPVAAYVERVYNGATFANLVAGLPQIID